MPDDPFPRRSTRQAAVARFRAARLDRRDSDLERRLSAVVAAAEAVSALACATQAAMHRLRLDRGEGRRALRDSLSDTRRDLHERTRRFLADRAETRTAETRTLSRERQDGLRARRAAVARLVAEDFPA